MVHREWVMWPSGRSVKWFPTAYSSPTLWAERPHPFWAVFMGNIAGVHWRTINRVQCNYCIPSNRLHNSVLVRALHLTDSCICYISQILLLYKNGGIKTNLTVQNIWGYITKRVTVVITSLLVQDKPLGAPTSVKQVFENVPNNPITLFH